MSRAGVEIVAALVVVVAVLVVACAVLVCKLRNAQRVHVEKRRLELKEDDDVEQQKSLDWPEQLDRVA